MVRAMGELITVSIPVYNTGKYLTRCLESVLHNTYKNLEVICINDGSTDNSEEILAEFEKNDDRVHVINKKNEGVSVARNTGLDMASGDLIAFIDSDDWVHPEYFSSLLCAHRTHEAELTICDFQRMAHEVIPAPVSEWRCEEVENVFDPLYTNSGIRQLVWGRLYSKRCIGEERFRPGMSWGEDTDFNQRVLLNCQQLRTDNSRYGRVFFISEKLYYYFQREDSLTNTATAEEKAALLRNYLLYLDNDKTELASKRIYFERLCKSVLAFRYNEQFCQERSAIFEKSKEIISECNRLQERFHYMPTKRWILQKVLFAFPWLYRCLRILNDPTLLAWEKRQRNKERTAK